MKNEFVITDIAAITLNVVVIILSMTKPHSYINVILLMILYAGYVTLYIWVRGILMHEETPNDTLKSQKGGK